MPDDTQDSGRSNLDEMILTILRMADERMLHDSGNPVYIRMKTELDRLQ